MGDFDMSLEIPADPDGFVLLQCPLCGEFFKLRVDECQAEDVYEIWCPSCGLQGDNYLTEEAIELAEKMVANAVIDVIYDEFKKNDRKLKKGTVIFKTGKKPTKEVETPLVEKIDALVVQSYKCCKRSAKINPGVKMGGSYCPYCGVSYDGD